MKPENWLWDGWKDVCYNNWEAGQLEPPVMDILARRCGWHPLVVGESMSIGVSGKRYEVKRIS